MSRRSRAATTAAAEYARRVARVQPFVTRRFPAYDRASKATRAALLNAYKALYGWTPKGGRGEDIRPLLSQHVSVVRFVANARERAQAKRDWTTLQAMLDADWKARVARWERSPNKQTPPPRPSVDVTFTTTKKPADIAAVKADIGQETPDTVKAVILRKDPVPGEPEQWMRGELVKLADRWISITGFHIVVYRPINPRAWVRDPQAEEARVMALLRDDFRRISAHTKQTTGRGIPEKSAIFAPQTGNHRYYDPALKEEERVHALLAFWRQQYGVTESFRAGRGATASWLVGINLIIYRQHTRGVQQFGEDFDRQMRRRIRRRKVDRMIQAARSQRRTKATRTRRKRR